MRNSAGEIIQCPLTEVDLLAILHFHDKLFSIFGDAMDIVDYSPVSYSPTKIQ